MITTPTSDDVSKERFNFKTAYDRLDSAEAKQVRLLEKEAQLADENRMIGYAIDAALDKMQQTLVANKLFFKQEIAFHARNKEHVQDRIKTMLQRYPELDQFLFIDSDGPTLRVRVNKFDWNGLSETFEYLLIFYYLKQE
jgi:hypothetical protein